MKLQGGNRASRKTRAQIRRVFAEMLSEKKELGKITVSELCHRADISRGSFYTHYDDLYGVAEDYENEMIDTFFDHARLLESQDISNFIDSIFEFIRENHENYKLLCRSNDFLFAAKKLTSMASLKLLELCRSDSRIREQVFLETELQIFLEGLLCEYVKYCRGYSAATLDELYAYTNYWVAGFLERRAGA